MEYPKMILLIKQNWKKVMKFEDVTIDHITPLSKGGSHELDNLTIACFPCNAKKSNLIV